MFFGHASASEHWGGLQLGQVIISSDDLRAVDWSASFVVLVGCETAALDTANGDLAWQFICGGARAVIGTTAKVRYDVADFFFRCLFSLLLSGMPVDYDFFSARRQTVSFEALLESRPPEEASSLIQRAIDEGHGQERFGEFLESLGLKWEMVYRQAVYSMTFSLMGGAGERIV